MQESDQVQEILVKLFGIIAVDEALRSAVRHCERNHALMRFYNLEIILD